MNARRAVALLLAGVAAVAGLSGLGGSTAGARDAPPPSAPTTAPARLRVLVVGESEAGTLATGSPRPPTPHGLSAQPGLVLWDSTILACSISSVPVFVLADGELTANRCGGTGHWQEQWARDVQATKPDAVFLMAGARDLFDDAGPPGVVIHAGDPAWTAHYTADVLQLFGILRSTGAALVAVKPPCFGPDMLPDGEPQSSERLDPARAAAVAAVWQAAARTSHLRLLDLDAVICPGGVADPAIRADGVHFTVAGADRLAPTITAALQRAVKAARARTGSAPRPRSGPARHD
jgi:lysophospholipase L1-like esterase